MCYQQHASEPLSVAEVSVLKSWSLSATLAASAWHPSGPRLGYTASPRSE